MPILRDTVIQPPAATYSELIGRTTVGLQTGVLCVVTESKALFQYNGSSWQPLNNVIRATTSPTVNSDYAHGFSPGQFWLNTAIDTLYICSSATNGAATWGILNYADSLDWVTLTPYSEKWQAGSAPGTIPQVAKFANGTLGILRGQFQYIPDPESSAEDELVSTLPVGYRGNFGVNVAASNSGQMRVIRWDFIQISATGVTTSTISNEYVKSSDKVFCAVQNSGTDENFVVNAVAGNGSITFLWEKELTVGDLTLNYIVLRPWPLCAETLSAGVTNVEEPNELVFVNSCYTSGTSFIMDGIIYPISG